MAEENGLQIIGVTSQPALTVIVQVPAEVVMFNVQESDLDSLVNSDPCINFGFLGMAVGGLTGFGITLLTVTTLGSKTFAAFVALAAVSGLGLVYFGIRSISEFGSAKRRLERIKRRRRLQ